jgi:hypothetical protein
VLYDLLLADAHFRKVFEKVFHGWEGLAAWKWGKHTRQKREKLDSGKIFVSIFTVLRKKKNPWSVILQRSCPHSPPV